MKLKEFVLRAWRYIEAFGYGLEYDPIADNRFASPGLESQVPALSAKKSK